MASFFNLSKLFWFLASPAHLLVWLLALSALLLLLGRRRLGGWLLGIDLVLWLALLMMPLGDALLMPLETRFPQPQLPAQVEGIIILGGGELAEESVYWHQPQFNQAAERFMVVPVLARRYPQAKILFSGGSGSVLRPQFRGGDVAKAYFDELGLGPRLLIDRDSRNTWENAQDSISLLGGIPKGNWLLVTSAFHMPRAVGIFRQLGWRVIPYPVDYRAMSLDGLRFYPSLWRNLRDLNTAVREWIGLAVYHWTGKTNALFPGPGNE